MVVYSCNVAACAPFVGGKARSVPLLIADGAKLPLYSQYVNSSRV
jgi:hypothetical protein